MEELNEEFVGMFHPVSVHMGINSGLAYRVIPQGGYDRVKRGG